MVLKPNLRSPGGASGEDASGMGDAIFEAGRECVWQHGAHRATSACAIGGILPLE